MRPADLIERKRNGEEHPGPDLAELVLAYARDEVPDYQMAAWCMAVFFRGLTAAFDGLLLIATPVLLERLSRVAPGRRPTAILLCRFIPAGLSLLLLAAVFLPAWLRYEPANTGEAASAGLSVILS